MVRITQMALLMLIATTLMAQRVIDGNGITGEVMDLQQQRKYTVTYVQVVFDFDSVTWGVYLLDGLHDDAAKVVKQGNLLKMKMGADLYPLSDEWNYITQRQFNAAIKSIEDAETR